ncbi:NAD(P)-dependent oxidoreductase [Halomonas binhaiensis]|uniref:NAD(P)H-binding protein n=1 Tax=Halomonas binhaiensis TaxID=2562282 RepID=A0A5C1NMB4_9GAMM|nr:NAD(P)H-binding protein [Halomonas binhaiensis]QEM83663.1 NAD(P)H-binding protein [Halomonas binhaiensis]
MKIIIFGGTGDVGRALVNEAVERGEEVTVVARNAQRDTCLPDGIRRMDLDLLDTTIEELASLMAEHDVAISSLRPPAGHEALLVELSERLLQGARGSGSRLLLTGGAATLKLADGSGHTVLSAPGFLPDSVRPIAEACAAQDALLDDFPDVDWVCLRPAANLLIEPGRREYRLDTDSLVVDGAGQSRISYADFAMAMLDLMSAHDAPRRLTAGWA